MDVLGLGGLSVKNKIKEKKRVMSLEFGLVCAQCDGLYGNVQ